MAGQRNSSSLAIATPSLDKLTETFIRAQIDFLKPGIVLHEGFLPVKAGELTVQACAGRPEEFPLQEALVACLEKFKIQCLLAQFGPTGAELMPACQQAGVKLMVHFHGYDASRRDVLNHYESGYRRMFAYAERVFVVSREMQKDLVALGCPPTKLVYSPCGVNDRFYTVNPQRGSQTFCFIGRFVEKKGPLQLIRAFQRVVQYFPAVKLVMAGGGPLLETSKELARQLQITENIFFPGPLPNDMVPALMQKAFAYVQHSITASDGDKEGTPVAVLEASASSIPVIATRHAGIPDAVEHEVTGLLVDEGDVEAMAGAMIRLLEDRDWAISLGYAGRAKMKREFSTQVYMDRISQSINDHLH